MKNSKKLLVGGLIAVLVVVAVAVLGTKSGDELTGKLKLRKNTNPVEKISRNSATLAENPNVNDDLDGDGLTNEQEAFMGTDPLNPSSSCGNSDYWCMLMSDFDEDGLLGVAELWENVGTDPFDADTDNDGFIDGDEVDLGTWNHPEDFYNTALDPCDPNPRATACMAQGASIERR